MNKNPKKKFNQKTFLIKQKKAKRFFKSKKIQINIHNSIKFPKNKKEKCNKKILQKHYKKLPKSISVKGKEKCSKTKLLQENYGNIKFDFFPQKRLKIQQNHSKLCYHIHKKNIYKKIGVVKV